jgi:hypothetical protein
MKARRWNFGAFCDGKRTNPSDEDPSDADPPDAEPSEPTPPSTPRAEPSGGGVDR